jgi:hypothetical protein
VGISPHPILEYPEAIDCYAYTVSWAKIARRIEADADAFRSTCSDDIARIECDARGNRLDQRRNVEYEVAGIGVPSYMFRRWPACGTIPVTSPRTASHNCRKTNPRDWYRRD